MRLAIKLSLFLLFVAGWGTCLLCGLGMLHEGLLGRHSTLLPAWLTPQLDALIRSAYWGLAVVTFSSIAWASLDRWSRIPNAANETDVLIAQPMQRDRLPGTRTAHAWRD